MISIEFQLLVLAGLLIVLAAVVLGLASRRRTSDPRRAFLLAVLHDLPTGSEKAKAHESASGSADSVAADSMPGPRSSDFFA
jgi:hypothetical protein